MQIVLIASRGYAQVRRVIQFWSAFIFDLLCAVYQKKLTKTTNNSQNLAVGPDIGCETGNPIRTGANLGWLSAGNTSLHTLLAFAGTSHQGLLRTYESVANIEVIDAAVGNPCGVSVVGVDANKNITILGDNVVDDNMPSRSVSAAVTTAMILSVGFKSGPDQVSTNLR